MIDMLMIYVVGAVIVGAVTSGWVTTRDHQEWSTVSPLSAWLYHWLISFLAALAWPLVVAGGISYGLFRLLESWWFRPIRSDCLCGFCGRTKLERELSRHAERHELELSIAKLEAELEIQQTVVGELGELPERPFIWIKTPTQN